MLAERGYNCHHVATNQYTEQLGEHIESLSPKHIVFPIFTTRREQFRRHLLTQGTQLYTGVASEEWLKPFEDAGVQHPFLCQR